MTTIMIDNVSDSVLERIRQIAAEEGVTISVFDKRESIQEPSIDNKTKSIHPSWSPEQLALAGAWRDEDFPSLEEIRADIGEDAPREQL